LFQTVTVCDLVVLYRECQLMLLLSLRPSRSLVMAKRRQVVPALTARRNRITRGFSWYDLPTSTADRSVSSKCDNLAVPRTPRRIGDRAFSVAAPRAWNMLPTELKLLRSTDSLFCLRAPGYGPTL